MDAHSQIPRIRYDGKWKGKVEQRTDPERLGRLRVRVVGLHGNDIPTEKLPWASPDSAAWKKGGRFWIPPVGELVWVEFEDGNPEYPAWGGGWWARYDAQTVESPDGLKNTSPDMSAKNVSWPTDAFGAKSSWSDGPLKQEGLQGVKPEDAPDNYIDRTPIGKHVELDDRKNLQKWKIGDQLDNYAWCSTEWGCMTLEASRGLQWDATRGRFRGFTQDAYANITQIYDIQGWELTHNAQQQVKRGTWCSPSGYKVVMDEVNGRLECWTPQGARMILDDVSRRVTLQSQSGQFLLLDAAANTIELVGLSSQLQFDDNANAAMMKFPGSLTITAGGTIGIKGGGDTNIQGVMVNLNGLQTITAGTARPAPSYSLPANPPIAKRAPDY